MTEENVITRTKNSSPLGPTKEETEKLQNGEIEAVKITGPNGKTFKFEENK